MFVKLLARSVLPILIIFLGTLHCMSQSIECGYDDNKVTLQNLEQRQADLDFESKYQALVKSGDTLTFEEGMFEGLPIVFHIVHEGDSLGSKTNPRNEQVLELIQKTNDYFRQENSEQNTFDNPYYGADTKISFCLASRDENGNPISGVRRYVSTDPNTTAINNMTWDKERYINVFLLGDFSDSFCGLYFQSLDLIYMANRCTSESILAHELGHYLKLKHTFLQQNSCSNLDCTMFGDLVCDTPPSFSSESVAQEGYEGNACLYPASTCDTDTMDINEHNPYRSQSLGGLGDQPDPNSNIMSYSIGCKNNFTNGQATRMHLTLLEDRVSLWNQETHCSDSPVSEPGLVVDKIEKVSENECKTKVVLEISLKNYSDQVIESATLQIYENGQQIDSLIWTGVLLAGETAVLTIERTLFTIGRNIIAIDIPSYNGLSNVIYSLNYILYDAMGSSFDYDLITQNEASSGQSPIILGPRQVDSLDRFRFLWRRANGEISEDFNTQATLRVEEPDIYFLTVYNEAFSCAMQFEYEISFDFPLSNPLYASIDYAQYCSSWSATLQAENIGETTRVRWHSEQMAFDFDDRLFITTPGEYRFEAFYEVEGGGEQSFFSDWYSVEGEQSEEFSFEVFTSGEFSCDADSVLIWSSLSEYDRGRYEFTWNSVNGYLDPITHPNNFIEGDKRILKAINNQAYALSISDRLTGCSDFQVIRTSSDPLRPDISVILPFRFSNPFVSDSIYMLDATASSVGEEFIYEWTTEGGIILSGENTLTPSIQGFGVYHFSITNENTGCVASHSYPVLPGYRLRIVERCINIDDSDSQNRVVSVYSYTSGYYDVNFRWFDIEGQLLVDNGSVNLFESGQYILEVSSVDYQRLDTITFSQELFSLPEARIETDSEVICMDEEVQLIGENSIINEYSEVTWLNSNGIEIDSNINTVVRNAGTYTLQLSDNISGCRSIADIQLIGNPHAANAGKYKVLDCFAGSVDLGINTNPIENKYKWTLLLDDDKIEVSNEMSISVSEAGVYQLEAYNEALDCTTVDEVTVYEKDKFATIEAVRDDKLCDNVPALLTVEGLVGFYNYDLEWTLPDKSVLNLPFLSVNQKGQYALAFTQKETGCVYRDTFHIDDELSFDFVHNTLLNNLFLEIDEVDISSFQILWSTGDTTSSISNLIPGKTYKVTVSDEKGCSLSSSYVYEENLEVENTTFTIYPNPTNGLVNIDHSGIIQDIEVMVYNVSGQELRSIILPKNEAISQIDLIGFPTGVYLLKLGIGQEVFHRRLVMANNR